jgi:hypothetical protein
MILDASKGEGRGYTILDAATGRCLDNDRVFYADSDRGFYRHYLNDANGRSYMWDRRTKLPATDDTPKQFCEVAWATVRRPIAIFSTKEPEP